MTWSKSFGFGSGIMYATPASGNYTGPIRLGVLQNVSLKFTFDQKPLYGQNQFPEAVARGKAKLTCKAAFAQIDSLAIATVFLQGTPSSGMNQIIDQEPHTIGGTAFTVTNSSGYQNDLGLAYSNTGQPFTLVTVSPAVVGTYKLGTTGQYVVSASDSGAAVIVNYEFNDGATGLKTVIANQKMGSYTAFQTDLYQINPEVPGSQWGARLYKCMAAELDMASKQDDWLIPDMAFQCYANPAGNVLDFNTPN